MRNLLIITILFASMFIVSDYLDVLQTLDAGGCCGGNNPNAKSTPGKNNGRNSGGSCGGGQAKNPNAEDTPKVILEWEEASIETSTADDVEESDENPIISQFEKAFEQQKPIIVFVYTDNNEKKYEAKRKQCESYMSDVLCNGDVGEQLEGFVRIKIGLSHLDDSKLRKQYKLSKSAPFVAIYDFTGKQYAKTSDTCTSYIVNKLKSCLKKNEKEVKKLEKKK